jgi:hypothetical protein
MIIDDTVPDSFTFQDSDLGGYKRGAPVGASLSKFRSLVKI